MPNHSRSSEVTKLMELYEIQRLRKEFSRAELYAYYGVLVKGLPKARKKGLSVRSFILQKHFWEKSQEA